MFGLSIYALPPFSLLTVKSSLPNAHKRVIISLTLRSIDMLCIFFSKRSLTPLSVPMRSTMAMLHTMLLLLSIVVSWNISPRPKFSIIVFITSHKFVLSVEKKSISSSSSATHFIPFSVNSAFVIMWKIHFSLTSSLKSEIIFTAACSTALDVSPIWSPIVGINAFCASYTKCGVP